MYCSAINAYMSHCVVSDFTFLVGIQNCPYSKNMDFCVFS